MINFNKNFKELKKNYRFGPSDICEATGISKNTLSAYEFHNASPSYKNIIKISNFFQVSIDYLLLNSNNYFVNFPFLFKMASATNKLPSMQRNHIEDSIAQFIKKNQNIKTLFDNNDTYVFKKTIKENLKIIREINNLSQGDIAKFLELKSRTSISSIERGASKVPYELLFKISSKYKISIHYLITGIPLCFNIKDSFLFENLVVFDKTASIDEIQTLSKLMQKILENNNITTNKVMST